MKDNYKPVCVEALDLIYKPYIEAKKAILDKKDKGKAYKFALHILEKYAAQSGSNLAKRFEGLYFSDKETKEVPE